MSASLNQFKNYFKETLDRKNIRLLINGLEYYNKIISDKWCKNNEPE
jgi:hypothetical protein